MLNQQNAKRHTLLLSSTGNNRSKPGHIDPLRPGALGLATAVKELCIGGARMLLY